MVIFLQSYWIEEGAKFDAAMMARCSICSAHGKICPAHEAVRGGRSFSLIGFAPQVGLDLFFFVVVLLRLHTREVGEEPVRRFAARSFVPSIF